MKIAVIGSGIGGLAIALRLALKGHDISVFEQNAQPGGKMGEIRGKGYRFDTGPSLFTLPELINELYILAGEDSKKALGYRKLEVLCKYFYNDDTQLVAYADHQKFMEECNNKLGEDPHNIMRYLLRAGVMYKLTADIFIFNSLHKFSNFLKLSVFKALIQVYKIRFYLSMHKENSRIFNHPHLIQLFDRYATYNGSNPFRAPATLNVIAHLENNLGAYFPEKGMYSLVQGIYSLAKKNGVKFNFNTLITRILCEKNRAAGIESNGKKMYFDSIVTNTDASYLAKHMMKHPLSKRLKKLEPSTSALVFYWGVKLVTDDLDIHNILFSEDYREEFTKLFIERTIYSDPTIYVFISSKIAKNDAPDSCENWFVMVNAPSDANQDWDEIVRVTRSNIISKINRILKLDIEDYIEFEKSASPLTIQNSTLSHAGALYGNSSNSVFSAFLRHPNFLSGIKNLYFVGGSVHPGGGIPLCLASAKIVDKEIPVN